MEEWDVFAIAGPSGVGKTSAGYPLARRLEVAIVEVDDLFLAVEKLTSPSEQPAIHYWRTHPEAVELPPEQILDLQLDLSRAMTPAVRAVIDNHIETRMPVVLDGDFILPEAVTGYADRVRAVFLYESDEGQIVRNYRAREPVVEAQRKRAQVSVLFGEWLRDECRRLGLAAIPARPFETVLERIEAAAEL